MRIRKSFLPVTTGVLLAVSGMALASPNPQKQSSATATKQALPKSQAKTGVSRGTITSIDNDRLVLSSTKGGKAEEQTFTLNSSTQRKGDLTAGAVVNVHFRNENNQLTATAIQAPQKTASTAKKPTVKKPKKG